MAIISYGYKQNGKKFIIADDDPVNILSQIAAIPFFDAITYGDECIDNTTGELYQFKKQGISDIWRKISHGPA